jgi:tetratricopeptide (TPR) repeat protein
VVSNSVGVKPFVFVLMPFSDEFREVYESGIKLACEVVGVNYGRADDQRFDRRILDHIYDQIQAAHIIVADMTGSNPNVFYEVGYAHALHKRVILLTKDVQDIPFDLKDHRHIVHAGRAYELKPKLIEELKWCLAEPQPNIDLWLSRPIVGRITRILGQVSKIVASQSEIRSLLDNILHEMTEILEADVCSIFLNEPDNPDVITCVAGSGFAQEIVGLAQYNSGEGFTGKVFQRGQTIVIGSIKELEGLRQRNEFQGKYDDLQWAVFGGQSQFRNCIASPLKIGDQTVGIIKVENKRIGNFTASDVSILDAITNGVLSVAIQNARLLESSRVRKSERWVIPIGTKAFLERNPNPVEPGYVFALLTEKTKGIYLRCVKKAVDDLHDLRCESLLDLKDSGDALDDILARIQKAEILVYDITDLTPNLMWELGVGLTIKDSERVIVICEESNTPLPFNISNRPVHRYDPSNEESLIALHRTLSQLMKTITRAMSRRSALSIVPEVKALLETALTAVNNKEWIVAEALFQTMDHREPNNWFIHNQWGIMHRSKGDYEVAERKFIEALKHADADEDKALIYTELAVLHQMSRKYLEAEEWFRKAEKADSENSRLYIAWADCYDELGDYFSAQAKIGGALARMGKGREGDPNYQELMLRHNYYGKKIKLPTYRKTFEQFKREERQPSSLPPDEWDKNSERLPYNTSWDDLQEKYIGQVVEGEISNITAEHGIFVRLCRDFTGVIFWRNLMEGYSERFSKGQRIKVRITKAFINSRDQRARIDLRLVE